MEGVPYTDREGQELNKYTTNAIVVEQIKNFIDQGKVWNQLRDGIYNDRVQKIMEVLV